MGVQMKVDSFQKYLKSWTTGEGMATHSSTLAWKIPWTEDHVLSYSPWGHKESDMTG